MISDIVKLNFVDSKYSKSLKHGGDGSIVANNMKKRIKVCKYCACNFGGESKCNKMWFEPLKYLYCSNCQNILASSNTSFCLVLNELQMNAVSLFRQYVNKTSFKIKNKAETGNYNGQPTNASKKVGTRWFRIVRALLKFGSSSTDPIEKQKIKDFVDSFNECTRKVFEMFKSKCSSNKYVNKIINKLLTHNRKNYVYNQSLLPEGERVEITSEPSVDDDLIMMSFGEYFIYPLFMIEIKRRNRKDGRFVPKKRSDIKRIYHSDYVAGLGSGGGDSGGEGNNSEECGEVKSLRSNIIPHSRYVQNIFTSVCILFLEEEKKSKTFRDTINKSLSTSHQLQHSEDSTSSSSSSTCEVVNNKIWVSKVYSIDKNVADMLTANNNTVPSTSIETSLPVSQKKRGRKKRVGVVVVAAAANDVLPSDQVNIKKRPRSASNTAAASSSKVSRRKTKVPATRDD